MKIAVLHVNSSGAESTSPTMRIARFVADEFKCPLIHDSATAAKHRKTKFDVLFVKYGMLKFSQHRDEALEIYANAKFIVNMENDYLFALDKRFRVPDCTWSTVEHRDEYVNWNILPRHGVDAWKAPRELPVPQHAGLVYYGAARPDRTYSFARYFREPPYPVTLSTFRGRTAFTSICGTKNVTHMGAFRNPDDPAQWPLTIYIEDEQSHKLYCSPATRFYECTMMGLAQVIDEKAVDTLKKGNIAVPNDFIVADKKDVKHALGRWEAIQAKQRAIWFQDYAGVIRAQLKQAASNTFGKESPL